jgi:quercetin dioxygenase-like cupin family protein
MVIDVGGLPESERRPGWRARFFHSDHMTIGYWDVVAGSDLHEHRHGQEEVWHVIEGELEMTVDGVREVVRAGMAAVVPAQTPHSARALTRCRAIVVDYPVRESIGGG